MAHSSEKASDGRVIAITGASRGIGAAIANIILSSDPTSRLILTARTESSLEKIRLKDPQRVRIQKADLSEKPEEAAQELSKLATSAWGRLDVLILNHAVIKPVNRICNTKPGLTEWRKLWETNVWSCIEIIRECIPQLRASKGMIILVSSGASTVAYSGWGAYGSSKASLNHLCLTLSVEERDITTVSIRPGVVDTEMQNELREQYMNVMDAADRTRFLELDKKKLLLTPEQPGAAIAKLALAQRRHWNGFSGRYISWDGPEISSI